MEYHVQKLYLMVCEIYLRYCSQSQNPQEPKQIPPLDRMVTDILGAYSRTYNREADRKEISLT